jgi:hypothetical protein
MTWQRCYYCNNPADSYCEDCGKNTCDKHASRDKHPCDDSVKGCHSIWKERNNEMKKPETLIRADSKMCYKCGKEKAHRWISVDPDIRPIAYCINCLREFENKLMEILK